MTVAVVDIAFKKIFGVEENKDLLISLINSIVSHQDKVKDLELLNPYNPKNFKKDKLSILDIKAQNQDGKFFNIEMQLTDEADYDKRALYYWARLYSGQIGEGKNYSKLNKTIGIHILNFISIPGVKKYHNVFHLKEEKSGLHHFKDIELHTIELSKFEDIEDSNNLSAYLKKVKTALDAWATFLTKHSLLDRNNLPKELLSFDPAIQKALHTLDVMNFTKAEREEYEDHLKWLRMEDSALRKRGKDSFEEGKIEGIAEGEAKGIIKGLTEEKTKIAKKMLAQSMDIQTISDITELTIDEINKIKKNT